jgi:hypothetical protein
MSPAESSRRAKVRSATVKAVSSGEIVLSVCCEDCESGKDLEVHHLGNYDDYRNVKVLCRVCHGIAHRKGIVVKAIAVTEEAYEALRLWSFHDPDRRTQQELASLAINRMAASAADQLLIEKTKKGETDASDS